MSLTIRNTFVNLPVKDLEKTIGFFSKVGFTFNEQYTNENSASMIVNENTFVMLLVEPFFQTFVNKKIADTNEVVETMMALSAESREMVDEIVNMAVEAGGTVPREPIDHGFMYQWGFQDINGHLWEFIFMDEADS